MFYRLEGKASIKSATGREWADWFEQAGEALIVAQDEIDGLFVLTVLPASTRAAATSHSFLKPCPLLRADQPALLSGPRHGSRPSANTAGLYSRPAPMPSRTLDFHHARQR
jgi:hypothetical protein